MENTENKYLREDGTHFAPLWRLIGFQGANLGANIFMGLTYFMAYYINGFVGLAVIWATSFTTLMRLWDGVTDPIVGFLVDKYGDKFGKTRFSLIVGLVFMLINSYLMFNVTNLLPSDGWFRPIFFTFTTMLFYIGYTFLNVGMYTGNVSITNDPRQRPIWSMTGTILVRLMRALMNVLIAAIVAKYGGFNDIRVFGDLWKIIALSATICIIIAYISIAPKDIPLFTKVANKGKNEVKFSDYLKAIKGNRPLQMMILAASTDKFAMMLQSGVVIVALYGIVAGNFKLNGGFNLYTTIIGLLIMAFGLGSIARKYGLKRAMVFGSWGNIIVNTLAIFVWILLDPRTLALPGYKDGYGHAFSGFTAFTVLLFLVTVLSNGFGSITSSVVQPMIADVSDYEAYRSGKYIPGMIGTLFSFIDKLVSAFSPTLMGLAFAFIGFKDKLPDITTPYSKSILLVALSLNYGIVIVGSICNLVAMRFYDLTPEKMELIQRSIHKKEK